MATTVGMNGTSIRERIRWLNLLKPGLVAVISTACIILISCGNPAEPEPDPTTQYYLYVVTGIDTDEKRIFQIDTSTDSIRDSIVYTGILQIPASTPDGGQLWISGLFETLIINTRNMTIERILDGLGTFQPFFLENSDEVFCARTDRIFYLRKSDYSLAFVDSSFGLLSWSDVQIIREENLAVGQDGRRWQAGYKNRYLFYDVIKKQLADSVDLNDNYGSPFFNHAVISPDHNRIFAFRIYGFGGADWLAFDRHTGELIAEVSFYSVGGFIFTNDGKQVFVTDPGDCHGDVPYGAIFKYDALNYSLLDTIEIRRDSGGPLYYCDQGIAVPGIDKIYVACDGACTLGPLLVIQPSSSKITKVMFENSNRWFGPMVVGKKF